MTSNIASSVTVTRIVVVAFVAITVGIPASFAQTPTKDRETPSVSVKYADLNLSSEAGSRALYARLVEAARQVCPERSDTLLDLRQNREAGRCITDTVQRAAKEIKHPRFTQLAASRMP